MPNIYQLTTDISISKALRDIILDLQLTPQTILATAVTPGPTATSIHVADVLHFNEGGLFIFDDDNGEETLPISTIDSATNTINVNFGGLGYTNIRKSHLQNTRVYSNLFIDVPVDIDTLLLGGDPVIIINAMDEEENLVAMRQVQSLYTFRIEYRRILERPTPQSMNINVWAIRQQEKARRDLETIANALRTNPKLQTSKGIHAESLGDRTNSRAWISKNWRVQTSDDTLQQYIAGMNVLVRAQRQTF